MKILHIHQDYPDGRNYPFTKAVSNLVDSSKSNDFENVVLSINRTSNPFRVSFKKFHEGYSIIYWALPLPFIYRPTIYFWSLLLILIVRNEKIDFIHAHKLTTEGLFSYYLSRFLRIPFVVSIRGGSDCHNLNRLWDCKKAFKNVFITARIIFWVSPWAKSHIENTFEYTHPNSIDFPNICVIPETIKTCTQNNKYCTILSFNQYKRKGIINLLRAIHNLKINGIFIHLNIIGSGKVKDINVVKNEINKLGLKSEISIMGQLQHSDVLLELSKSRGFLLPSLNETFGMSYVEALACGCPILYISNTGIDGHIDDISPCVKLADGTVPNIVNAIKKLEKNINKNRDELLRLHSIGYFDKFTSDVIVSTYRTQMNCLVLK